MEKFESNEFELIFELNEFVINEFNDLNEFEMNEFSDSNEIEIVNLLFSCCLCPLKEGFTGSGFITRWRALVAGATDATGRTLLSA